MNSELAALIVAAAVERLYAQGSPDLAEILAGSPIAMNDSEGVIHYCAPVDKEGAEKIAQAFKLELSQRSI